MQIHTAGIQQDTQQQATEKTCPDTVSSSVQSGASSGAERAERPQNMHDDYHHLCRNIAEQKQSRTKQTADAQTENALQHRPQAAPCF